MSGQFETGAPTLANLWAGAITALVGIAALTWLIPEFVTGATSASKSLTPGFMPRVAAWWMVILGAIVALGAGRVLLNREKATAEESEENEDLAFGRDEIINTLILMALSAVYLLMLSLLGFIISATIVLMFLIYVTGYRNLLVLIVVALLVPIGLELLLWHLLQVPLPQFPMINF